jgi:hypothetical protein
MRNAASCLLLSLLLAACGPTEDQGPTRQALVNAQTARDAVSQLTLRYGEILNPAGSAPGSPVRGWEGLGEFRKSAEGLASAKYLSEFSKPIPVDPAHTRSKEILELSRATAELVSLALEPRGTWEAFAQEVNGLRSRLDRAQAALETGTKSFVLVEVRTKTEENAMAYSKMLSAARAGAADPAKKDGAVKP